MTRDQLKLTRMAKTMTLEQIGEIIGMDKSSVCRMISGKQPIVRSVSIILKSFNEK